MKPVIQVEDVYYSYRQGQQKVSVLQGCSFSVMPGEFLAIQGPSGSGKSTLLNLLGGMSHFQSGQVSIFGKEINLLNNDEMAEFRNKYIGFVFQQFHLLPRATVLQNILLPTVYPLEKTTPDPSAQERAAHIAEQLGLTDRLRHLPQELSGGQQQRVAIARALINGASLILADEPTGNLDSKSSKAVMEELKKLKAQGKTIVLITHDPQIAKEADRVVHIHDGRIVSQEILKDFKPIEIEEKHVVFNRVSTLWNADYFKRLYSQIQGNLFRNKARSVLTMLGVSIGVAAVLAMVTLGNFAKDRILSSYADLGINTLNFYAYPNWGMKATDSFGIRYRSLSWDKDLVPLKSIFPQVVRISPILNGNRVQVEFAGRIVDGDVRVNGVSHEGLFIMKKSFILGNNFSEYHVDYRSPVCVLGYEVAERLFSNVSPLGQLVTIREDEKAYGCRVQGVLARTSSRSEFRNPNLEVYIPYTYFKAMTKQYWNGEIHNALLELKDGSQVENSGKAIRSFFERKYGKSGRFRVDSDSILLEQMNRFLNIFSIFLASVALISLTVGGIGIANMMLVSVSERYREIGLRKALGATDKSIKHQFLGESILLCVMAGVIGLIGGFASYQLIIWGASKLVPKMAFEWVMNPFALIFSSLSIFAVGLLSGYIPASRAEKLSPVEALRSE